MKLHKPVVYRHREAVTCCPECQSKDEKDNLSTAASAWCCMLIAKAMMVIHLIQKNLVCLAITFQVFIVGSCGLWMAVLDSSILSKQ